ncbi:MAG: hypothetical protein BMS9Abin30_0847 [Gammaproteobacteria bacterium]|nr:MAG: hypothetical protein BMS9Abin30_0847 [Gammaproteobacteria bacterium]
MKLMMVCRKMSIEESPDQRFHFSDPNGKACTYQYRMIIKLHYFHLIDHPWFM